MKIITIGLLSAALAFTSCKKEGEKTTIDVASSYSGDFDSNPPSTLKAADNLETIASTIKGGKDVAVTAAQLTTLYTADDTSLKDLAATQFDTWAATLFTSVEKASAASVDGNEVDFTADNLGDGGSAGKRLFDGSPIEPGQLAEKGAFGGVCFYYVKNNLFANPASVSKDDLDKALVLFGSVPSFEDNRFSAKYAASRELNDANTYLEQIYYEFRKAQSAIDQNLESEKIVAVNAIMSYWEEAIMAQAVHYLYASSSIFADGSLDYDDDGYIGGIHSWSEAVAFIKGFYKVDGTLITDSQIESILTKINAPIGGDYDVLTLINSISELEDVTAAIDELAAVYGFTASLHK